MIKKLFCVVLALALATAALGALAEGLTVHGTGSVSLNADVATITLGIRQYASDVKVAQQAVNRSMDAIIEALSAAGVQNQDMYTNSIYIYPEYDYSSSGTERISGYTAGNSLTVVTRDIDNVGAYIDAAFDAGANTLDEVGFSASDTTDAYDEALALAIAQARHKAEVIAQASGLELGGVVRIAEGENYNYGGYGRYAAVKTEEADDAGTRVIAARQQVNADVTVEFEILDNQP